MHGTERRPVTLIHVVEVVEVEALRVTKLAPEMMPFGIS